jgi:amidase
LSDPLDEHDATALAALVRKRLVHPRELVEAAIDRAERLDPVLNAFVHTQFERALADADHLASDASLTQLPFAGVPFAFKDYQCREAGESYHQGMRVLHDLSFRATTDSPLALRFRAAGLIPIGRTNTSEMAIVGTTEPEVYGPTRNPWDLARVPAGSSGGSAAAVAAGIVPAAHGNDIAGSIRLPAAAAGLVGLKPTRGRVVVSTIDSPIGMFSDGVITRSVRDTAGLLDAITTVSGPWPAPVLARPLTSELGAPIAPMRVGVWVEAFNGADVDDGCRDAALECARTLEAAGHRVSFSAPAPLSDGALWQAMSAALAANAAHELQRWSDRLREQRGTPIGEDDVEAITWRIVSAGAGLSGVELVSALATIQRLSREAEPWWVDHDLLITPASSAPSQLIGSYLTEHRSGRGSAFTRPFNATGQPAIVVPLGWPADGLPRGVQIVAPYGREDVLIRVASFLETTQPWWHRRP